MSTPTPIFEPQASAKVRSALYWLAGFATIVTALLAAVVPSTWPDSAATIMLWVLSINTAIDAAAVWVVIGNRPTKFPVAQQALPADDRF